MKAAFLGHQYLTVKSVNKSDSYFVGGRSHGSQRNHIHNIQSEPNRLLIPATDPLSRRSTFPDEPTTPSVAVITRSLSDSSSPYAIYQSEPTNKSEYERFYERFYLSSLLLGRKPYSLISLLSKRRGKRLVDRQE